MTPSIISSCLVMCMAILMMPTTCSAGVMEYDLYFDEKCEFPVGAVKRFTTCVPENDGTGSSLIDCSKQEVYLHKDSACQSTASSTVKLSSNGTCMNVPGSTNTWMVMTKCTTHNTRRLGTFPTPHTTLRSSPHHGEPGTSLLSSNADDNEHQVESEVPEAVPKGFLCSVLRTQIGCKGTVAAFHCMFDDMCFTVGASLNTRGNGRMSSKFTCATGTMKVWTESDACVGHADVGHTFDVGRCDGSFETILRC